MQDYLVKIPTKYKVLILISIVILMIIIFMFAYKYYYHDNGTEEVVLNEVEEDNNDEENIFEIATKKNKIIVHVVGEVNNPGVVTLDDGARIIDAIKSAGDKTEDADLSKINLAYIIEDGSQIYVPRIGENREELITEEPGNGVIIDSSSLSKEESKELKVNINTASIEKLITLPGVGNSTAQKIINYREENGKFKDIEDLKNVPGIGESKYNNLKEMITTK